MYNPIDLPHNQKVKDNYFVSYSIKNSREITFFRQIDYEYFLQIEFNPIVSSYCERPCKIQSNINKQEDLIIDFWLRYKNGREEMQSLLYSSPFSMSEKMRYINIERYFANKNIPYILKTKSEINFGGLYIENLKYLYALIRRAEHNLCEKYLLVLKRNFANESIKLNEIVKANIIPIDDLNSTIAYGIFTGQLKAPIETQIFDSKLEVSISYEKKY